MADVKISALPTASVVNPADILVLNQGGTTKTATKALVVSGLATTAQISGIATTAQLSAFQNSAQVRALASAQIAAITPASIGALSTAAASGFATTGQISGFTNSAQVQALTTAQLSAISINAGTGLSGGGNISASRTLALTTTGVSALSYGSATQVAALTIDAYGRITSASNINIDGAAPERGGVEWTSTTDYSAGDIVSYSGTQNTFVSQQGGNVNHSPIGDDGTWWKIVRADAVSLYGTPVNSEVAPLTSQGLVFDGTNWTSTPIANAWQSSFSYSAGQIVSYSGSLYISLQNSNSNKNPEYQTIWWQLALQDAKSLKGFEVSSFPPITGDALTWDGAKWFPMAVTGGGLNSAQVQSLASAQIAAITPASLGAVATSDIIAISKGGTGSTSAVSALSALGAAGLASPAFTGTPTAPTAAAQTNTTQIATTEFVISNRGDSYLTQSNSTSTIGNGTKTFTVETGLSYTPTQDCTIVFNSSNHMHGVVVTYFGTTLVVDVTQHTGSGSYSVWTINVGGLTTAAGALLSANNLSDVANTATALTNIGGVSTARTISAGTGLTGGGDLSANRTLSIAALSPDPTGTYGSTSQIPSLTVNNLGQVTAASSLAMPSTVVEVFSTPGTSTWTKPAGAKQVVFELVSGGGGGGCGGKASAGTAVYGGGGGGAGGYSRTAIAGADLTDATYAVTVGAGGTGGIFNGAIATVGGVSAVAPSSAPSNFIARAASGVTIGGAGGTALPTVGSGGGPNSNSGGTPSITGGAGAGANSNNAPSGGGAGGGCSTSAPFNGGSSLCQFNGSTAANGTLSTTGNGGAGGSAPVRSGSSIIYNGSGGAGGGATTFASGSGGNGSAATGNGCGGGGGGCTTGSGNAGNGGAGGNGIVVITTYF